jgi:tetratricopeptide (TPR) repeat protein
MVLAGREGEPPTPHEVDTPEELTARLRLLQAWAGLSYRAIHREVVRDRAARGVPERPVLSTVFRCLQAGRPRLDVELVVDVARALLGDGARAEEWRQACHVVLGRAAGASMVVVDDALPEDLPSFTGRHAELRAIMALAETGVVAAIAGMPGIGKTRLAVHAGHALLRRGRYTDLQLAVDLRGYDPDRPPADPAAVLGEFLRRLGLPGDQIQHLDLAGRAARYRALLAGRRALILLDNAATADQVRPLLPEVPGCLALVTSRRSLPDLPHLALEVFSPAEAVDLLRHAAGPDRVAADPGTTAAIAAALGHLPLALALVAARIRASPDWTLTDHLDRLRAGRDTLRLEDGVDLAVGTSYRDLPAELRRLLRLLALHPGHHLDAHAAAALAGTDLDAARAHLDHLAASHLLQRGTADRYRFHDLIRVYATGRAQDEDPVRAQRAALTRLFDHYARAAALAMDTYAPHEADRRPRIPDPGSPVPELGEVESATGWLERERPNLIAVAVHAARHGWPAHAGDLSGILGRFLHVAGHYRDGEILHTEALRVADRAGRCRELGNLGTVYWRLGEYERAVEHYRQSLAVAREIGDPHGERRALGNLGNVYRRLGRYAEAQEHHERSLAIARRVGSRGGEGIQLVNLGSMNVRLGRCEEALGHFRLAASIAQQIGDHEGECIATCCIADVHLRLGRYDEAADHYRRGLRSARQIGDRGWEARALDALGAIHRCLGRYPAAVEHHERALAIAQETAERSMECDILNSIGETLHRSGASAEAAEYHRQALEIADALGEPDERARSHDRLAVALAATGRRHAARTHWRQALALYTELGVPEADQVQERLAPLTV